MDDKELLYKICIIINHKYDLCYYPVDTLTEYYDTFKNAWENEETYSVLSFFIEIAPKKEVELFLQRVNKKFAQQITKKITNQFQIFSNKLFKTDYLLNDEFVYSEDSFREVIDDELNKMNLQKIKERAIKWVNKKENKVFLKTQKEVLKEKNEEIISILKQQKLTLEKEIENLEDKK